MWFTMKKRKRKKKPSDGFTRARFALNPARRRFSSERFLRRAFWLAWAAAVLGAGLSARSLLAKEKKVPRVVTGVVLDASENGVAGASVELTDVTTGKKLEIYTPEGGRYLFSDINPHHDYEVQASYKGVSSQVRKASSFDTRNRIVLDLRIPPPKS